MNKSIMPCLTVLAAILANAIQAQEIPQEFLSCALLDDDAARLSCFDREMTRQLLTSRDQPAIVAAPNTPVSPIPQESASVSFAGPSAAVPSVAATNDDISKGTAGAAQVRPPPTVAAASATEAQFGNPAISDLDQVSLTVTKVGLRPHGEHIVYLDNGQVWSEQTKSSYFPVNAGETVTIKKRKYGGYRLLTESGKAYDVERLR